MKKIKWFFGSAAFFLVKLLYPLFLLILLIFGVLVGLLLGKFMLDSGRHLIEATILAVIMAEMFGSGFYFMARLDGHPGPRYTTFGRQ